MIASHHKHVVLALRHSHIVYRAGQVGKALNVGTPAHSIEMDAINRLQRMSAIVASDEQKAVATHYSHSIGSRFGQHSYESPVENVAVNGCRIYSGVVCLLARRGKIASASHNNPVAYLCGITCRHAQRIAGFGSRKAKDGAYVLCRSRCMEKRNERYDEE